MVERGEIPQCEVLLADSGYDCRGNKEKPSLSQLEGEVIISLKIELTSLFS